MHVARRAALGVAAPIAGALLFVSLFAMMALPHFQANIRWHIAMCEGMHSAADMNAWFTDRMLAWVFGEQSAIPGCLPLESFRDGLPETRLLPPSVGYFQRGTSDTAGTLAVVAVGMAACAWGGAMLGAMTAFGTRRASLEPSVRGVVARAALDAAWNCGARASALGGVAGLLAWYISFDRSCSLGQDRIFDLQWSSLLALIPVGIWSAVTTAHTASAMICRRLEGRSVCGNCGYPLNAGTLAPCPECGPARTHGASGRPVWRQQCFALGVSTTIGMLLAMGIGGCESQFMKATWTRWLVLRSNLVSKGIRAWIVPNKTFHMTWARENLRLRIVAPGPGFKTLGVQVCDADGNQVLPEEIRTEEHRGVVHARFVVHGSKFTVRGPWWYAGPVYMVDFEKAPESFEEARGPVELCP